MRTEQCEKFFDILKKWMPATVTNSELYEDYEYSESYVGWDVHPLSVGYTHGGLKVEGYSKAVDAPYIISCRCGHTLQADRKRIEENMTCGCWDRAVRTAYLIRLRIEALRVWMAHMQTWLKDLEAIKAFSMDYLAQVGPPPTTGKNLVQREQGPYRPVLSRNTPTPVDQLEFLDFFYTILPPPHYAEWLTNLSEHALHDHPLWEGMPMNSLAGFEDTRTELPEFDSSTFISLLNFIEENHDEFFKGNDFKKPLDGDPPSC